MNVACAFDHAGVPLQDTVLDAVRAAGHEPLDLGAFDDYPDAVLDACAAVHEGRAERAVIVCGSSAGVSIGANKLPGIRAGIGHDHYTAGQCVTHDNCNVLCLGARVIGPALASEGVANFLAATFSGEPRHVRRLGKISALETEGYDAVLAPEVNPRLAALVEAGTSPWLDQLRRDLATSGELSRMVVYESLRGLTSNPSIFEKAMLSEDVDVYDAQVAELARAGLSTENLYVGLAVTDLQLACDALRPVWDVSSHQDGFCSLEVPPGAAHDTEETKRQAQILWGRVSRPNLMIKIPGTPEGLSAIEDAIYAGHNINVTLLFSVEAYETVAEAYIRGLERRHAEGLSLDVHSVASFFVSRVDTEVDKRLEALGREDLKGTAAVANARAAYRAFERIFGGERFATLAAAGAHVQRPLWASTGVKDPAYPPTKYIDELVGPDTVNTMPLATLQAAGESATVDPAKPTADLDPAPALDALREAGVDMADVTDVLLKQGVEQFVHAFDGLLAGLDERRRAVLAAPAAAGAAA